MRLALALAAPLLLALTAAPAIAQGLLIPTDPAIPPLALKHHRVTIDVRDGTAVTTVEQVYRNSTPRMLEATYVFPVPDGAVVMDFRLMIDGKMQKGEVLEKDRANQIYTDIVRRMQDPGIVDWLGKDLFRARIFPVPAHGEQKITIQYTQVLPFLDGTYKLSYPMKTSAAAAQTLEDFTLTTRLSHSTPVKAIYSPSHKVAIARRGEHEATIGFEGDRVVLDRDFTLYFGVSKRDVGLNLLTYNPDGEAGFFLLMAAPKAVFDTDEIQGKAITFVLDTSGSMTGQAIAQAKQALRWCLDHLGSDDRFNVIRFSSDVESFEPRLVAASRANIDAAKRFVDGFEAAGGTAMDDALAAALAADTGSDTHLVLFLTDGRPTVGETDPKAILARVARDNRARARVFALGIGDDLNTHLLDKLAEDNGGTSAYVTPDDDMDTHIGALYNQIAFPVLTDVSLDFGRVRTFGVLPGKLPDIFRGGQLLLVGRYRGDGDTLIRLEGRLGQTARRFDFEGRFPARRDENAFIASLWAHRQVGVLLDQIRLSGETQALKDEVIQLATRFGIVTPYTSYLVVEEGAVAQPAPLMAPPRPIHRPTHRPMERSGPGRSGDPEPAAPPRRDFAVGDEEAEALALGAASRAGSGGSFRTESGAQAVEDAKVVRRLKDKDRAGSEVSAVRRASDRVMSFRGGRGWVDNAINPGLEELTVAPFSAAWVQLATALPALRDALSLGDRVSVRVGDLVIAVRPGGAATLAPATLARIARAAAAR